MDAPLAVGAREPLRGADSVASLTKGAEDPRRTTAELAHRAPGPVRLQRAAHLVVAAGVRGGRRVALLVAVGQGRAVDLGQDLRRDDGLAGNVGGARARCRQNLADVARRRALRANLPGAEGHAARALALMRSGARVRAVRERIAVVLVQGARVDGGAVHHRGPVGSFPGAGGGALQGAARRAVVRVAVVARHGEAVASVREIASDVGERKHRCGRAPERAQLLLVRRCSLGGRLFAGSLLLIVRSLARCGSLLGCACGCRGLGIDRSAALHGSLFSSARSRLPDRPCRCCGSWS